MLPAWMAPEPAPLDSVVHYPPLAMVQVGDVSVPLRDGRAVRPKANENAKTKIRTVPARPRSVAAAPRQPDPEGDQHNVRLLFLRRLKRISPTCSGML